MATSNIPQNLLLDVNSQNHMPKTLYGQQGDSNSNEIYVTLYNNGIPYTLTSTMIAKLQGERPQDNGEILDDCIIKDGKIIVKLTNYILEKHGNAKVNIVLLDSQDINWRLSTPTFFIKISKNPLSDNAQEILEDTKYTTLINGISKINNAVVEWDTVKPEMEETNATLEATNTVATNKITEMNVLKTNLNNAESTRVSSENTRISSENTRKSNETARQTAEAKRQSDTSTAIANTNTAKDNCITLTNTVQTKLDSGELSGVWTGSETPTNDGYHLWVDPDGVESETEPDKMAVLRVKDELGVWQSLPAIKGDKGDKGDKGETGASSVAINDTLTDTEHTWSSSKIDTEKLDKTGDISNTTTTFTQEVTRENIVSGESVDISMGKISKYLDDTVTKDNIANNLITTEEGTVLGGEQGKILNDKIGILSDLTTTSKTDLVGSVNEVKASVDVVNNKPLYEILPNEVGVVNAKFPYGHAFRYGALADGVNDDAIAFTNALLSGYEVFVPHGTYLFKTSARIPNNGVLAICGDAKYATIISQNVVPFTRTPNVTEDTGFNYVHGINISNLIFNGEHVRGTFPYMVFSGNTYTMLTAFSLEADINDSTSFALVNNCQFKNIPSLPFSLDNFKSVKIMDNKFFKCRDVGLRSCMNIIFTGNDVKFGADNGVSLSRGCKNADISNNIFSDVESAGVWIAGYNVERTSYQSLTVSGSTYTIGSIVTLTTSSQYFNSANIGQLVSVYSDTSTYGVVKITSVDINTKIATGRVFTAIPVGCQNVPAYKWYIAPANGAENVIISNNVINRSYCYGVNGTIASKDVLVTGNKITGSGFICDSEIHTDNIRLAKGSKSMYCSTFPFVVGDVIMIDSKTSFEQSFISTVVSIQSGSYYTLQDTAPESYYAETAYLLHVNTSSGSGVFFAGNNIGGQYFSEKLMINNNKIHGYTFQGISLGSTVNGSVKNVTISNNDISQYTWTNGVATNGILIQEYNGMLSEDIIIINNVYRDNIRFLYINQYSSDIRKIYIISNILTKLSTQSVSANNYSNSTAVVYSSNNIVAI